MSNLTLQPKFGYSTINIQSLHHHTARVIRNEGRDDDDKVNDDQNGDDDDCHDDDNDDDDDDDRNLEAVERAVILDKEVFLLAYREVVTKLEYNYHYHDDDDVNDE